MDRNQLTEEIIKNLITIQNKLKNSIIKKAIIDYVLHEAINYENFIYKEIEHIYDYEIIRRALKLCIENQKTREKATTAIRKVLFKYEDDENIIMMDTYKKIIEVRNAIELHYIY